MRNQDPIFRRIDFFLNELDKKRLIDFDASFTTDRVYRLDQRDMSATLVEVILETPLYKKFRLDLMMPDIAQDIFRGESFFAEVNGDIAGFLVTEYENWNRRAILRHVYVAPEFRGRGLGRTLIKKSIDFAKERSSRCLWLETQNINFPAIQVYKKMGFRFCGFDDTFYDPEELPNEIAVYFAMEF